MPSMDELEARGARQPAVPYDVFLKSPQKKFGLPARHAALMVFEGLHAASEAVYEGQGAWEHFTVRHPFMRWAFHETLPSIGPIWTFW